MIIKLLNIDFKKIYLTKKFSILKLVTEDNFNIGNTLEILNETKNTTEEYERKIILYNKNKNKLDEKNIAYLTLSNVNIILQNEIKDMEKKLDKVKDVEVKTQERVELEESFLRYQMLLFKFYIIYFLKEDIEKSKLQESFLTYQKLLFKLYIIYVLKEDIEKSI